MRDASAYLVRVRVRARARVRVRVRVRVASAYLATAPSVEKEMQRGSSMALHMPCGIWKRAPSGRLMPWMRVTDALEKAIPAWVGVRVRVRARVGEGHPRLAATEQHRLSRRRVARRVARRVERAAQLLHGRDGKAVGQGVVLGRDVGLVRVRVGVGVEVGIGVGVRVGVRVRVRVASIAWQMASMPVSAVRRKGLVRASTPPPRTCARASGGEGVVGAGRGGGGPTHSIFSCVSESVTMVNLVASLPVPAVVGIATIGSEAPSFWYGAL
eukprot:scaffold18932_cov65-Phaeocystis_antarctica.AAC.4